MAHFVDRDLRDATGDFSTELPDFRSRLPNGEDPISTQNLPRVGVAMFGDNHGCNPEYVRQDLIRLGAIYHDGVVRRDFPGNLIQMGDLLDRGDFNEEIYMFWKELRESAPDKVVQLLGNHDLYHLIGAPWIINATVIEGMQEKLLEDVRKGGIVAAWAEGDMLYTHAGLVLDCFPEYRDKPIRHIMEDLNRRLKLAADDMRVGDFNRNMRIMESDNIFSNFGIFWTRDNLENSQFRQTVGHTPQTDGIKAEPGARVKYVDSGRVFGEGAPFPESLLARQLGVNTELAREVGGGNRGAV